MRRRRLRLSSAWRRSTSVRRECAALGRSGGLLLPRSQRRRYELRQELVRRGAFERFFPGEAASSCCYDTLLKANVDLLREDEAARQKAQHEAYNAAQSAKQARLAEEKELRKKEALERSARRQAERQKAKESADSQVADENANAANTAPA